MVGESRLPTCWCDRHVRGAPESAERAAADRAVRLLGIGSRGLHRVATSQNHIKRAALVDALCELGDDPAVVCLSAGDINTGIFDDFSELIPVCRDRPRTWVHVDGAFGLWVNTSSRFAHLLKGAADADSWATDGHKWLNTPYDIGFVACRDRAAHRGAMSVRAPYLTHDAEVRDQIDWNPEWSRRGRGVPVYAVIRALGRRGIRRAMRISVCNWATGPADVEAAIDAVERVLRGCR